MFKLIQLFTYYWQARTAYSMHSPLLYSFCREVLDDRRSFYAFEEIEIWRYHLLHESSELHVVDLGAGGQDALDQNRIVSSIAKTSLSPPWKCRYLFRMVLWWKPDLLLEFGTSLGVSTAYLAAASIHTPLITVDGSDSHLQLARKGWNKLGLDHIEEWNLSFQQAIQRIPWDQHGRILIYLDGDHRPARVLEILQTIQEKTRHPFLVIIDDIRWSDDMWAGWQEWRSAFQSGAWLDLYQVGIWIQDPAFLEPQIQTLIPSRLKPIHQGWI
ncbi:MAG: class I SAM-dependent methyltransferase [Saprospiraceae bacterium]|nr:class I SAM-dependent methyltransferase [Saprospiraceae bacterium]